MGLLDLDKATSTDMQNWNFTTSLSTPEYKTQALVTIDQVEGDVVTWIPEWAKWNGYYRTLGDVKGPIDTNVLQAIGQGWTSKQKALLEKIRGNGKDIFDSIAMNFMTQYEICGDSFTEIIRDTRRRLINLKPLNPGEIRIVANIKGIISRYEQIANREAGQGDEKRKVLKVWNPEEIFHLPWNRIANEIHGISRIEKLSLQIKKIQQAKDITSVIHRRHMTPVKIWEVDTDDTTEMATFKGKVDGIYKNVENLVVPMGSAKAIILQMQKGTIEESVIWLRHLEEELTKGFGVPNVTQGSESGSSEATSKILHLNYQPRSKLHRMFIEKQMKAQLNIEIEFKESPSIDPALLTDARKNTGDDVTDNNPKKEVK